MSFKFDLDEMMDRRFRVAPTLDPKTTWLHVTDMQITTTDPNASGYLTGGDGAPTGDETVEACKKVIDRCREEGIGVSWSEFGVADDGSDAGLHLAKVRFWYPNGGSDNKWSDPESATDPRLERRENEPMFRRPKPSAFAGTLMHQVLTGNKVETLVLVGLSTSYCIRNTAIDAFNFNIPAIVLADCTTAYDPTGTSGAYVEALRNVQGNYGDVLTSDEFFSMLDDAKSR